MSYRRDTPSLHYSCKHACNLVDEFDCNHGTCVELHVHVHLLLSCLKIIIPVHVHVCSTCTELTFVSHA